jgi:hypothetical protein
VKSRHGVHSKIDVINTIGPLVVMCHYNFPFKFSLNLRL